MFQKSVFTGFFAMLKCNLCYNKYIISFVLVINFMKRRLLFVLIFLFIIIFVSVYFYFENTKLHVSNYFINDTKIPIEFNKYKIIQISDFHNTKSYSLTNSLVEKIKEEEPNIIVLTGDFIDSRKTNIEVAINFIKRINNIAQIYFVSGNHESRISEYSKLKEELVENDVIILNNKTEILKINDSEINLIGIDDPQMLNGVYEDDNNKINYELTISDYDKNKYSILLSHRPELFETYVDNNINLVFTGHAHGGQIRIPFIGGIIAPNQGLFPKYTSGIFTKNETNMIVSRGIGNSLFPFRINNNPELVIVELNNK